MYLRWHSQRPSYNTICRTAPPTPDLSNIESTVNKVKVLKDMNYSEFITLMPLLTLVILLGVYPNIILDTISTSVENLVSVYNTKIATFNNLMIK